MGRPPSTGGPAFRFTQNEVAEMEAILQEHKLQIPSKDLIVTLSEKFSQSTERIGKVLVQTKQVWNWFQNRRYALRSKLAKPSVKLTVTQMHRVDVGPARNVPQGSLLQPAQSDNATSCLEILESAASHEVLRLELGRNGSENPQMEYEAKSAKDGAWYDVQAFLSHRYLDTRNPEVLVRFAGFGLDEEEWVNVRKHIRQRSLPCESSECVAVLAGDLILCFQEGKEQALYFDAHVVDAQRRRHDVRGCRCRFLVRYDHDQTEEIVPLKKVCRRPETDYRLQQLHFLNESASMVLKAASDPTLGVNSTPAISSEAVPFNHKPSTNPSISVFPAPVQENASTAPETSPSEPKNIETGASLYTAFAGSAQAGANAPPN